VLRAIQADFVWGFRFACPRTERQYGPAWCAHVAHGYSEPVPTRFDP
jgi:hypothetical protein